MKWIDNPIEELWLKHLGGTFEKRTIRLDQIDWAVSLKNCGRLGTPIRADVVEDYALAMTDPAASFPRTFVEELAKNRYGVLSGNHRLKSADEADFEFVEVYVAKHTDPTALQRFARTCNQKIGLAGAREDRLKNAAHDMKQNGLSASDAARLYQLKPSALQRYLSQKKLAESMNGLVPPAKVEALHLCHLSALNKLKDNHRVLAEAVHLVVDHQMTDEQTVEATRRIKAAKTELDQLKEIEKIRQESALLQPGPPTHHKLDLRTNFLRSVTLLDNRIGDRKKLSQLQITENTEAKATKEKVNALVKKLQVLTGCAGKVRRTS